MIENEEKNKKAKKYSYSTKAEIKRKVYKYRNGFTIEGKGNTEWEDRVAMPPIKTHFFIRSSRLFSLKCSVIYNTSFFRQYFYMPEIFIIWIK